MRIAVTSGLPASHTLEQQHLAQLANILYMLAAARAAIPRARHMQAGPRKWSLMERQTLRAGSRLRLHACRQLHPHSHASVSRIAGAYLQQQTNTSHGVRAAEGVKSYMRSRARGVAGVDFGLYAARGRGGERLVKSTVILAKISLDAHRTYPACSETATSIDRQREKELYVFAEDARATRARGPTR
ncbi:hypothetical protein B0H17DRAFT_1283341 [Mycena rosella]|uniref:Uncharacterized protein n=1 Tax=Mycena rosella TaxID=1033263 RepID=A0AAD7BVE2_MYCRO|nr:hypothetical protein B0H17DRAFT_1283341 [Mycena rosella]